MAQTFNSICKMQLLGRFPPKWHVKAETYIGRHADGVGEWVAIGVTEKDIKKRCKCDLNGQERG